MSIVVNPHKQHLSEAQQQEILERDRQYEAGQTKIYSLEEVIAYFNARNITGA
jgi:hypothetical protein